MPSAQESSHFAFLVENDYLQQRDHHHNQSRDNKSYGKQILSALKMFVVYSADPMDPLYMYPNLAKCGQKNEERK